ncbi:MAG: MFS transporter [Bryobacteraceae bacterium]|nr:MFS transporter [Bryobacteraceae bacterium]
MRDVAALLRHNADYRRLWLAQVVSELGDYFNNVAVFALAMERTGSGLVASGVMLARAIPAVAAGPVAGVLLDRFDRKRIMVASDLVRAVVAAAFVSAVAAPGTWLLYPLSAALMFASPFFTSGRNAILPDIASTRELHTANSLTQTTSWATITAGAMLGGLTAAELGYAWAFWFNAASFLVSALLVARIRSCRERFPLRAHAGVSVLRPWSEYRDGLRYIRSVPLLLGITLLHVGWAAGGGAAQILFALFGDRVFGRGAAGIGLIWGFAGLGLLVGGVLGYTAGKRAGYRGYKRVVTLAYLTHGATYVAFSLAQAFPAALFWIALSRVGMAVCSVLNYTQLLRHTADAFRGRVFATMESARWAVMMLSMAAAGLASEYYSPRAIGVVAGLLGCLTAFAWAWADWRGKLPEPDETPVPFEEARLAAEPPA